MVWLKPILMVTLVAFVVTTHSRDPRYYRLSTNHIPKRYSLRLIIDPDSSGFSGEVMISFATRNETNSLRLHAASKSITINEVELNALHVCNVSMDQRTDIANITCPTGIGANENNQVLLKFAGSYQKSVNGLYKDKYLTNKIKEYFVATQFEPTFARMVFPCFDEPQLKAEFDVMIVHPEYFTALSNSPISYRGTFDNFAVTKFRKTPIMSTYLLAFVVSKFSRSYAPHSETGFFPISIYYRSEKKNETGTAMQYGGALVDAHSKFTGIDYAELGNSKLDLVGAPTFWGAMENWGLVIFQENMFLDEGNKTTPEDKQSLISTMAHELAHQWFGNYVTLDWWSDVWLNEGFAAFFQSHFDEHFAHLDLNLARQFVPKTLHVSLIRDETSSSPLCSKKDNILTPEEIASKFDQTSYDKGPSIIRMMRSILGKENFQQGIRQYLKENAHKNVNSTILLDTLGAFYNSSTYSFGELLHNWIYEQGYPLINVSLSGDGKSVRIQQEDFYFGTHREKGSVKWHVPISHTTSIEKQFDVRVNNWLYNESLNIDLDPNSWIIINLQQTGYYRVNYDTSLWYRIIRALKSNDMKQIHVSNRAQLLDDTYVLAGRKRISYRIFFELAQYVTNETEFEPWYVFSNKVVYLISRLRERNETEAIKSLENLTLGWINQAFPSNKPTNLTTHLQKLLHNVIEDLKLYLMDPDSMDAAQFVYNEYIANKNVEDSNARKRSLCYGMRMSSTPEEDYNILLEYYLEADSLFERKDILSSIGCSKNMEILQKCLLEVFSDNSRILKYDTYYFLEALFSNNELGLDAILQFLEKGLEGIKKKYGDMLKIPNFIKKLANKMSTEEQIIKLKGIIEQHQELKSIGSEFIENHLKRIFSQEENTKEIVKILNEF